MVFLYSPIREKGRGSLREIKSYINDRSLERPKNHIKCSKMVEVVEYIGGSQ